MQRFYGNKRCERSAIFWVWALYSLAMVAVSDYVAAAGLPSSVSWVVASLAGLVLFFGTWEL
jgi:hypothetical protein